MRLDRSKYTLDEALSEINYAEHILDGMGAPQGKTPWGRIAGVKAAQAGRQLCRRAGQQERSGAQESNGALSTGGEAHNKHE